MARPDRELASSFTHPGVAAAYRHRPPYPQGVFELLGELIADESPRVLDLGAGEGALARPLAAMVEQVDAVDPSEAMIQAGRRRPGGDAPNLHWIQGVAETCPLNGPYGLIVAGASFHWFDWPRTLCRLPSAMTERAVLAIVGYDLRAVPWEASLQAIIGRHSRSAGYDPEFDILRALEGTGHYAPFGERRIAPQAFRQRVADYVESLHSTSSLARELMTEEEAESFDRELTELVAPHARDGELELVVEAIVGWGRPR